MSNSLRGAAKACSSATISKWNNVAVIHLQKNWDEQRWKLKRLPPK
jgi:hypothetical protein